MTGTRFPCCPGQFWIYTPSDRDAIPVLSRPVLNLHSQWQGRDSRVVQASSETHPAFWLPTDPSPEVKQQKRESDDTPLWRTPGTWSPGQIILYGKLNISSIITAVVYLINKHVYNRSCVSVYMQPAESTRQECGSEMTAKVWALIMELLAPRRRWIQDFGKICGPTFIRSTTPLTPTQVLYCFHAMH